MAPTGRGPFHIAVHQPGQHQQDRHGGAERGPCAQPVVQDADHGPAELLVEQVQRVHQRPGGGEPAPLEPVEPVQRHREHEEVGDRHQGQGHVRAAVEAQVVPQPVPVFHKIALHGQPAHAEEQPQLEVGPEAVHQIHGDAGDEQRGVQGRGERGQQRHIGVLLDQHGQDQPGPAEDVDALEGDRLEQDDEEDQVEAELQPEGPVGADQVLCLHRNLEHRQVRQGVAEAGGRADPVRQQPVHRERDDHGEPVGGEEPQEPGPDELTRSAAPGRQTDDEAADDEEELDSVGAVLRERKEPGEEVSRVLAPVHP